MKIYYNIGHNTSANINKWIQWDFENEVDDAFHSRLRSQYYSHGNMPGFEICLEGKTIIKIEVQKIVNWYKNNWLKLSVTRKLKKKILK